MIKRKNIVEKTGIMWTGWFELLFKHKYTMVEVTLSDSSPLPHIAKATQELKQQTDWGNALFRESVAEKSLSKGVA